MRQERTLRGSHQKIAGKTPENPFTHARMTIGSCDNEVRAILPKLFHRLLVIGKMENPSRCFNAMMAKPRHHVVKRTMRGGAIGLILNDLDHNYFLYLV